MLFPIKYESSQKSLISISLRKMHSAFLIIFAIAFTSGFYIPRSKELITNDLRIIHSRSHLLSKSVIDGMKEKPSTNVTIPDFGQRKNSNFIRACYYVFSSPGPEKLNGTLCTHIIGGFASVRNGTLVPSDESHITYYIKLIKLKQVYPGLKIMLSAGGGGNDAGFSWAAGSVQNRTRFISSVISFLTKYGFDGFDIDWEFPVWNDHVSQDKSDLVLLLRDFKAACSKTAPLLLSVAVGSPKAIIDVAYDIPAMGKYVDFINMMSYDYHDYTWYMPFTGHNSPLFNRSVEHGYFSTLNTAWSAIYWASQGMPLSKILVGLPTYGHTYKLSDPTLTGLDAPATGPGLGDGVMTYPEVCAFVAKGAKRMFNEQSQVPYAFLGYDWIGYDDYDSITAKTKWVKSKGFGGVMTFDLNCDDWQGICDGKTRFPLHQIIYDVLGS